ncbi:MAG: hypothetical protein LBH01_03090 [Verrucomicrobiales bacterium]|jgi:hypothetical protein|nr:hypothetical protein [Verrucomicrobiales bacterium]
MRRGVSRGLTCGLLLLAGAALTVNAQESSVADLANPKLVRVFTDSSDDFPISVRSPDSLENATMLSLAEDSYRVFLLSMGIQSVSGFSLRLTWDSTPLKPPYDSFAAFPRKVELLPDGSRVFTIMARGPLANGNDAKNQEALQEELYRSCMACYLQALVWSRNVVVKDGSLSEPPFWLSEGLTQLMMKSRHDTYAKIVANYQKLQRLPSLEKVQEWSGFSDDFLESRWQQAFAYWLVRLATAEAASKQALVLWLSSGNYAQDHSFLDPNPQNESWWESSISTPLQSFKYYGWDKTVELLNQLKQIDVVLKASKPGESDQPKTVTIRDLPSPKLLKSVEPVHTRIDQLGDLQLKGHPAWSKIIEFYRLSLQLWLSDNQVEYKKCIANTEKQETDVNKYMSMVGDYMDWVTVNMPVNLKSGMTRSNSKAAQEIIHEDANLKLIAPAANGEGNRN